MSSVTKSWRSWTGQDGRAYVGAGSSASVGVEAETPAGRFQHGLSRWAGQCLPVVLSSGEFPVLGGIQAPNECQLAKVPA